MPHDSNFFLDSTEIKFNMLDFREMIKIRLFFQSIHKLSTTNRRAAAQIDAQSRILMKLLCALYGNIHDAYLWIFNQLFLFHIWTSITTADLLLPSDQLYTTRAMNLKIKTTCTPQWLCNYTVQNRKKSSLKNSSFSFYCSWNYINYS